MNQPDVTTRMVDAVVSQWPLVAALVVGAHWWFPKMLKNTLMNGGGEIIRGIVAAENKIQSDHNRDAIERIVNDAIKAHERVEQQERMMEINRFRQEVTDRFVLKRGRR